MHSEFMKHQNIRLMANLERHSRVDPAHASELLRQGLIRRGDDGWKITELGRIYGGFYFDSITWEYVKARPQMWDQLRRIREGTNSRGLAYGCTFAYLRLKDEDLIFSWAWQWQADEDDLGGVSFEARCFLEYTSVVLEVRKSVRLRPGMYPIERIENIR